MTVMVVGTIMWIIGAYFYTLSGVWMYKCRSIYDIKEDFINTLKMCHEITIKDLDDVKWYKKLVRTVLRIFAPLM